MTPETQDWLISLADHQSRVDITIFASIPSAQELTVWQQGEMHHGAIYFVSTTFSGSWREALVHAVSLVGNGREHITIQKRG